MLGRTMNRKTIATGLKTALAAGAMLAAGALATPAAAQTHVKIGLLTCATGPTIGLIIASTEKARCTFHPDVGDNENYSGHIRKFGLEVGVEAGSVIVWAVFSPQQGYAPGSLAGVYVGATAEASLVVGLGANVLIGGSKKQFALQPLSVQAQAGVNIAVGVGELDLTKR
jgi:hypothetical protein